MTLTAADVVVCAGGTALVDVPALRLEPGRPVTVVGASGSGKSLLAHALVGTLPPELAVTGRAVVAGTTYDLADRRARRPLWGRVLALLPQEPALALDPTMRVGAQVAEAVPGFRADRAGARRTAGQRLAGLGLPGSARSWPHTLSGGMAQRVAFAAATVGGAQVLVADEPSKGLDDASRDRLAALLEGHVTGGGLLLTITHDLALARRLGGEVLVMRDAVVVESGDADAVLTAPQHAYTRALLGADPARWPRADVRTGGEVLLAGTGLAKSYGGSRLFADLDVEVRAGERTALSGPSGAGKTTLGRLLLGLEVPDAGTVTRSPHLDGGRLQRLYQDPVVSFPPRVPLRAGLDDVVRRHGTDPARVEELLGALGLPASLLDRRPGQVSGGELQRLAVLRAVLLEPRLVFADEPTSRLDLLSQQDTVRCLLEQVDRLDCALVLVTHDAALADAVCGRRLDLGELPAALV